MSEQSTNIAAITVEELCGRIDDELLNLHHAWDNFVYLFATDEKRVKALNSIRGGFLARMQKLMFADVLLRISRLVDDSTVAGKPTVSLAHVLARTEWQATNRAKWSGFNAKLARVRDASQPCRDRRNAILAHNSLRPEQLTTATRKMVDDAIVAIEKFFHEIAQECRYSVVVRIADTEEAERLLEYVFNRRSQKDPALVAIISYDFGDPRAEMICGFCGARELFAFYPDGLPAPDLVARRHFAKCDGVVGFELVKLVAVERNNAIPARVFTLDLSSRTGPDE